MFKDLSEINEAYSTFDAIGWKKKGKLYIYINPKHEYAPVSYTHLDVYKRQLVQGL